MVVGINNLHVESVGMARVALQRIARDQRAPTICWQLVWTKTHGFIAGPRSDWIRSVILDTLDPSHQGDLPQYDQAWTKPSNSCLLATGRSSRPEAVST